MSVGAAGTMRALFFLVLLHLACGISGNFIIYGTGTAEIRIKRVKTKETIKSIKIQVDEVKGNVLAYRTKFRRTNFLGGQTFSADKIFGTNSKFWQIFPKIFYRFLIFQCTLQEKYVFR